MNLKSTIERLGLRDFQDPEARQRANDEQDLCLNMTLTQALLVTSAFDFIKIMLESDSKDMVAYADAMKQMLSTQEAAQSVIKHMTSLSEQTMKEVYRKQREIYADSLH